MKNLIDLDSYFKWLSPLSSSIGYALPKGTAVTSNNIHRELDRVLIGREYEKSVDVLSENSKRCSFRYHDEKETNNIVKESTLNIKDLVSSISDHLPIRFLLKLP